LFYSGGVRIKYSRS